MIKDIFNVRFRPFIDNKTKEEYLNTIKNEWNYPSITNFLNTLVDDMKNRNVIIIKMDKPIIDKFMKKINEKNYTDVRDWFKHKIISEINE